MKIEFRDEPAFRLLGYSPDTPRDILRNVTAGVKPSALNGDFILVAEGIDEQSGKPLTLFTSTVVAAIPYYYYLTEEHCVHAGNVTDCCKNASLSWEWNWDALAQQTLFDHLLGDASLHKFISKVPKASIIKVCGADVETYQEPFWGELYESADSNVNASDVASVLIEILSELPANEPYSLSLSAGYDSRVLLACMSYLERSLSTATIGEVDSTDVWIARQIALSCDYEFERVPFDVNDYITYAEDIMRNTSGEHTFWHWHTGVFSRKVSFDPSSMHLVGSNGEFARSYYFDKGLFAEIADLSRFSRWDYWLALKNSTKRRIAPEILDAIDPGSEYLNSLSSRSMAEGAFVAGMRFGDGLDYFYTAERVRNFIGLGLAMYRTAFPTMSPFLDSRFVKLSSALRRQQKLGDRLPRSIIEILQPSLLDFPVDESGVPMRSEPGLFYFLNHKKIKGYARYADAQKLPQVIEWSRSGFGELGGDLKRYDTDNLLRAKVNRWILPITLGAFKETVLKPFDI